MPEGAVYVGRPTVWGNPFKAGSRLSRRLAVDLFADWINQPQNAHIRRAAQRALAGRDLACWCPLDKPCHADVLLKIANETTEGAQ